MSVFTTRKAITVLGFMLLPILVRSQTVNLGELTISSLTQFSTLGDLENKSGALLINNGEAYVYANLNNDGLIDFVDGEEGIIRFEGTETQLLSGSNVSYFYNVLFNNNAISTSSFHLSSTISVANEVNFNMGIIQNDSLGGSIIFEENATHLGTSNESHTDGLVIKKGDNNFMYPIGDSNFYRPATINMVENDMFEAKYYLQNPIETSVNSESPTQNTGSSIIKLNNAEFWTVTGVFGADAVLTLSWDESTTPTDLTVEPEKLHIVRWDESQQIWIDEGGIVDVVNKTVTTPTFIENYGIFTLGSATEDISNVEIHNVITPNEDTVNDYFFIDGIENLANNNIQIFNRWGVKVFETDNYDSHGNVFDGYSKGRQTINTSKKLPSGTYFYIINFDSNNRNSRQKKTGYLYINY